MHQPPPDADERSPYFFAVLDGHGGDEAAKEMSTLLTETLNVSTLPAVSSGALPDEVIDRYTDADDRLRARLSQSCTAGTTCTSALVHHQHYNGRDAWNVTLINAGDSRSLLIRAGGEGFESTQDHKPDLPSESARIRAAGGFVSNDVGGPSRVDNNLAVSRAFGDFEYKDVDKKHTEHKISCVPDVTSFSAKTGDIVFLACDGIFDVMSNEEVVAFISSTDLSDVGTVCADLLTHVLEKGSKDNCSAMIVVLGEPEKYKEADLSQATTIVPTSKWQGWHTGYWTEQLIVGNRLDQEEAVKVKFKDFHASFGFLEPLPEPCGNCRRIYAGMQVCSRCKEDIYCSHWCQKRDWKTKHKEKCNKKVAQMSGKGQTSPKDGKYKKK